VAVGFELAKKGLAWYVSSVATYSTIYGAFASAPIFLLWLYLGWVIVLMGAVVAAYAPSLQMRVVRQPDGPGQKFVLALDVIRALHNAQCGPARGLSVAELSELLRVDPLQIDPLLEALMTLDWVARLDEPLGQRHVLLCRPEATAATPLIDQFLLSADPGVERFRARGGFERMALAELIER
jgi:membrane protein